MSQAIVRHAGLGVDPATDAQAQITILQNYFVVAMGTTPPTIAQLGAAQVALGQLVADLQTISTQLATCTKGATTPTAPAAPGSAMCTPDATKVWVSGTAAGLMTAGAAGIGGAFGWWLGKQRRSR